MRRWDRQCERPYDRRLSIWQALAPSLALLSLLLEACPEPTKEHASTTARNSVPGFRNAHLSRGASALETRSTQARTPPLAPMPPAASNGALGAGLLEGNCPDHAALAVHVIDETHCDVPKGVFFGDGKCLLARPALVSVAVRGQVVGFRDDSIGRKSVYALCGIRAGDVWAKVNGHSLAGPDAVLDLYARLRESEKLVIDLLRAGAHIQVEITFR